MNTFFIQLFLAESVELIFNPPYFLYFFIIFTKDNPLNMCNNSHCVSLTFANFNYDTMIIVLVHDCISNHNFISNFTFK
ncbi:hypothetical protein ABMA09_00750 [Erwinia rhapontici]